jgi:hypothetical protein
VTAVTAYRFSILPLVSSGFHHEELQVGIGNGGVCEVGPGGKDFIQNLLAGVERFSLLFWQICGGIENPHCFDSHLGVLAQSSLISGHLFPSHPLTGSAIEQRSHLAGDPECDVLSQSQFICFLYKRTAAVNAQRHGGQPEATGSNFLDR